MKITRRGKTIDYDKWYNQINWGNVWYWIKKPVLISIAIIILGYLTQKGVDKIKILNQQIMESRILTEESKIKQAEKEKENQAKLEQWKSDPLNPIQIAKKQAIREEQKIKSFKDSEKEYFKIGKRVKVENQEDIYLDYSDKGVIKDRIDVGRITAFEGNTVWVNNKPYDKHQVKPIESKAEYESLLKELKK